MSTGAADNCFNQARCDTEHYASDINALPAPLCGYADWRVPAIDELLSIVDFSARSPTIAAGYFPLTGNFYYWSATPSHYGGAWLFNFEFGFDYTNYPGLEYAVRLVRGGQ